LLTPGCLGLCVQWRWASAWHEIDITGEGGALAKKHSGGEVFRPAVCGGVLRAEGEAYAEFTQVDGTKDYGVMVGVARAGVDPTQEMGGKSNGSYKGFFDTENGWMYQLHGAYSHNGYNQPWASGTRQGVQKGETVGLLLRRGSLHIYIKGKQVGTMVTGLTGEFVWATDLYQYGGADGSCSVRIARKPPPAQ